MLGALRCVAQRLPDAGPITLGVAESFGARAAAGRRSANELACPTDARVSCSRSGPARSRRSDPPGNPNAAMKSATPEQYLASLPADRRAAMRALHSAIRKAVPKLTAEIMMGMGSPVIGYGKYHYKSASGREGDWFLIGLTSGKNYYSLHICAADKGGYLVEQNAAKLGKVKTGRSCINFKKLEDLKLDVAMALVKQAVKSGGLNAEG